MSFILQPKNRETKSEDEFVSLKKNDIIIVYVDLCHPSFSG
jgi:hypothetical protein